MTDKSGASGAHVILDFFKVVGLPDAFICDKSPDQTAGEARKLCNLVGVSVNLTPLGPTGLIYSRMGFAKNSGGLTAH